MRREDYHPCWKDISRQIREQAGNVCEQCGIPNGAYGARDVNGEWHAEYDIHHMHWGHGYALFGTFPIMRRVVLTVHHLCDCDKRDCYDPTHLRAMCQRCHLNADRPQSMAKAATTRQRKRDERAAATWRQTSIP